MKRIILLTITALLMMCGVCFGASGITLTGTSLNADFVDNNITARIDAAGDGSDFLWVDGLDLSQWAGVAGSRARITLTDSSGNQLVGYAGSVGAGETLGSELVTGFSQWSPSFDTLTTSGADITSAITSSTSAYSKSNNLSTVVLNGLYCSDINLTLNSGNHPCFGIASSGSFSVQSLSSGSNTFYNNSQIGGGFTYPVLAIIVEPVCSAGPTNFSSVNSFKRVTDPPSTGLHIYTTATGSTRGWATQDSGFDYNGTLDLRVTPGR
jgi:hypothetical protein